MGYVSGDVVRNGKVAFRRRCAEYVVLRRSLAKGGSRGDAIR